MYYECHCCSDDKQEQGYHVKFHSSLLERREESGTDLYAQGIYEEDEPEILDHVQHVLIDREPEMSGEDAGKEYECHSKRDTLELYLSERQSDGTYQAQYENGLYKGLLGEYVYKPVHF